MSDVPKSDAIEIVAALRTGVVPAAGLHHFATGLGTLMKTVESELHELSAGAGSGRAKWLRGGYGSGKTFASRLLCARARARGFATSEVQISINDTPLHRLATVYRRAIERLTVPTGAEGAFPSVVDLWLFQIGDEVMRLQGIAEGDPAFPDAVEQRLENKLAELSARNPTFAQVLRGYHRAMEDADFATAQGLMAWLSGEPNIAHSVKKTAGVKGAIDGAAALTFLRGVLQILRDTDHRGLVLVLDEAETVQQMRSDVREKALNALRQLVDTLLSGDLPGMYLVVTGTPEFFDGYKGIAALPPLRDRVDTRFSDDPRFDNLRAPQVRLPPFDVTRLADVGTKISSLYPAKNPERVSSRVTNVVIDRMVEKTTRAFGGHVDVVPRLFLRRLVDVMDRVDQYEDYEPLRDKALAFEESELRPEELAAMRRSDPNAKDAIDADAGGEVADQPTPKRLS